MFDKDDLKEISAKKEALQEEIETLEARLEDYENLQEMKGQLAELRKVTENDGPIEEVAEDDLPEIPEVKVNPDTGKPPRGARSEQIVAAIEILDRDHDVFKAADIYNLMREADDTVDEGQRAYLYSRLNELQDKGLVEKVKRGTWKKVG